MRVHPLKGPSLDFHLHNGTTKASILVILYLLGGLSLEGNAAPCSVFHSFVIRHISCI